MIKELTLKNIKIKYDLQYKSVKNINLRIKADGTVHVSANRKVPNSVIEGFLISKTDFILNAIEKFRNRKVISQIRYYSVEEVCRLIVEICKKVYPYFEGRGVAFPQLKFRKMVSRWGSCHSCKGVLTFNVNLMYAPIECIEYVVFHEFCHFLQANHSKLFYAELEKVCPDWKNRRKKLKEIVLR